MKMRTALICVLLYLESTVAQIQLRVYRGNLVHSRELKQIEVLRDHLLGFDANKRGEVTASVCLIVIRIKASVRILICSIWFLTLAMYMKHTYSAPCMQVKRVHTIVLDNFSCMYLRLSLAKQIDRNVF